MALTQRAHRRAPWAWRPRAGDRRTAAQLAADRSGRSLVPLGAEECWRLLGSDTVGRLVYTYQALPAVVPVSYAVRDESVLVRTSAHSRIGQLPEGTVVAFEVDDVDRRTRTGWSVVLVGTTETVADDDGSALGDGLPWVDHDDGVTIRVAGGFVSGRHLVPQG